MFSWTTLVPLAALALLGAASALPLGAGLALACGAALIAAVVAAVHHAEVVAHRVGEPLGTLVLALAITVIETALIVSLMLSGGAATAALARDTLYATVMIICNGVVGLCVLAGGVRHQAQSFKVAGVGPALAALVALSTLTLVMPVFTTSSPEGTYTRAQLAFVALASTALWAVFVFVQTVRHRDYFLPDEDAEDRAAHAEPPGNARAAASAVLLMAALVAVVGLAKALSPGIEQAVEAASLPKAVVGVLIAVVVLVTRPSTVEWSILIDSAPRGAEIRVDGKFIGNTPQRLARTSQPTPQKIEIIKKNFRPYVREVSPQPGGTVRIDAELEPEDAPQR